MEERNNNKQEKAGLSDLVSSVVGLGEATTKFTINQMQNAVGMLTHPTEVIDRARESIEHFSKAMSGSTSKADHEATSGGHTEPASAEETLSGRKL
jgi:hypothetical protein